MRTSGQLELRRRYGDYLPRYPTWEFHYTFFPTIVVSARLFQMI